MQGAVGCQREWRGPEFHGTYSEEQVVHDGITRDGDVQYLSALDAAVPRDVGDEAIDALANDAGEFAGRLGMHRYVRHAAHEILAEAYLRVHDAARRYVLARRQVEVRRYRRGSDIDREPVDVVPESRPYGDDARLIVHRDGHPPVTGAQGLLQCRQYDRIAVEFGQLPLPVERVVKPLQVAGGLS